MTKGGGAERETLDALSGMVGLVELILARDDLPDGIKYALRVSHRLITAREVILGAKQACPEPPAQPENDQCQD